MTDTEILAQCTVSSLTWCMSITHFPGFMRVRLVCRACTRQDILDCCTSARHFLHNV